MTKNGFDELMSIGVDIGKDVFHLVGFDKEGQLTLRKMGFEPWIIPAIYVQPFNKSQSEEDKKTIQ